MARILVYSSAFFPSVGGLEMMAFLIARELGRLGHEVRVVTNTRSEQPDNCPFAVIRAPNWLALFSAVKWSQVVLQFNVNLRAMWTWGLIRRPLVVSHQGIYGRPSGRFGWRDRMKYLVARKVVNIAASPYVAAHLSGRITTIPNAYDDEMFRVKPDVVRNRDFLFVGRLVSDKGADDFVKAFAKICQDRPDVDATIVGIGPESGALAALARSLGIEERIQFLGVRREEALVDAMNQHRFLVVPSKWDEPFGIVALEGIACGCIVIGSGGGGLGFAIGGCGFTFPNGDLHELTGCMERALDRADLCEGYRRSFPQHLAEHSPRAIASRFETVLLGVVAE